MSILRKPYEISIWGDEWNADIEKFDEKKLLIIGTNQTTSQSRAMSPKLVENVNGTHTFTFSLYYKYRDNITGEMVDNPYAPYMTNERKIKLQYDGKWYDFIIKSIKIDQGKYTYDITATDQYVNELSKNGFNKTFDAELCNNVGTVQILATRALEDTDWRVIPRTTSAFPTNSEFIPDLADEVLVKLFTLTDFPEYEAVRIHDPNSGQEPTYETVSIPAGVNIYAFYSCLADHAKRFQFIYIPEGTNITKDDERIITNKECQYYIDDIHYQNSINPVYGFYVPQYTNVMEISSEYRGARYVFSPDTNYNPVIQKYVSIYKDKDQTEYYGYSEIDLKAPNLIQNWVTNPNAFKSTAGWAAGTTESSYNKGKIINQAYRLDEDENVHILLDDLKSGEVRTNTYTAILSYTAPTSNQNDAVIVNTGFYDNRTAIGNLENKQMFVCRSKGYSGQVDLKLGSVNQGVYTFSTSLGSTTLTQERGTDYYSGIITIQNSTFTPKTFKKQAGSNRVYIVLSGSHNIDKLEDFQIFPYVQKDDGTDDGTYMKPEDQLTDAIVTTTHTLYNKSAVDGLDAFSTIEDLNAIYNSTIDPLNNGYTLALSCEKRRALTAKESNYFNIIQTLCETFECWAEFSIIHDANGAILNKAIIFHNYIGQQNWAGFRYGVNLKSISRTDDSKQIVTKLIVKQNSNEFGEDGFCTIARAPSNETGEIYIYNMDHYINQGLLSAQDWINTIYVLNNAVGCDITPSWNNTTNYEKGSYVTDNDQLYKKQTTANVHLSPHEDSTNWSEVTDSDTNSNGYYYRLRTLNNQINAKNAILLKQSVILSQAQSDLTVYQTGLASATDSYEEATESFYKLTGYEYGSVGASAYNTDTLYNIGDRVTHVDSVSNVLHLYVCNAATTRTWDATKWDLDIVETNIDYLVKCAEFYQAKADYTIKVSTASSQVTILTAAYNTLTAQVKTLIEQKESLNKAFYKRYYRFIQEGTWTSEEYYDDEKYYLDALSTLYNSSVPKVSYIISVLELSQLQGYEDFTFAVGDRTYVEDVEFFGYDSSGAPIREEVVLSEISYSLDEPDKNSIKVQNFKTSFQDLFKRITATVQQVQFSTGAYDKAAQLANADDAQKSAYLQGAINDAATILQNLAEQTVRIDTEGLTITDGIEPNRKLRAVSGGILLTEDGGNTWTLGITANGVSAKVLTSGTVNTSIVNIMNGNEATFRWDAFGLTAYNFDTNGQIISNISQSGGVRFDRLGIYGFTNTASDWHPTDVVAWTTNVESGMSPYYNIVADGDGKSYIRNHSTFELTKEGLYLNLGNMLQNHYKTANYTYGIFGTPIAHVSQAALGRIDDLLYNNWNGSNPYYDTTDTTKPAFVQIFKAGASGQIAMYDDGTLVATKAFLTGKITANSGSIGGWTIANDKLYKLYTQNNNDRYTGLQTGNSDDTVAFFAGATGADGTNAVFSVTQDGTLTANGAEVKGRVVAQEFCVSGAINNVNNIMVFSQPLQFNANVNSDNVTIRTLKGSSSITEGGMSYLASITVNIAGSANTDGTVRIQITYSNVFNWDKTEGTYHTFYIVSQRNNRTLRDEIKIFIGKDATAETSQSNDYQFSGIIYQGLSASLDSAVVGSLEAMKAIPYSTGGNHYDNVVIFGDANNTSHLIPYGNNTSNLGSQSHAWKEIYSQNGTVQSSDLRLKKDINDILKPYDTFFDALHPVIYRFINGTSNRLHTGFIAQEVLSALTAAELSPLDFGGYCHNQYEDGTDSYSLRYGEFISLNTWQIQLLKSRISDLENRIATLEANKI